MPQDGGCKFFNEYKLCYQTLWGGGAKSGPRKIITVHKQFIFNNEHFSSQMPAPTLVLLKLHVTRQRYFFQVKELSRWSVEAL